MGGIIFLLLVGVIVIYAVVSIKIGNLKYRAKQQILRNTGASSANISATIDEGIETKQMEKLLKDYPNFTEENIKTILKQYSVKLIQRNRISEFSEDVCEKMQKDSKLEKMMNMIFKRINIKNYRDSFFIATIIYTDNRDEYNLDLYCNIVDDKIIVQKYSCSKGQVLGF